MTILQDQNLRWSLDFMMDTLVSGRRFRILTLVDDFTREYLGLVVDISETALRVLRELEHAHEPQRERWIRAQALMSACDHDLRRLLWLRCTTLGLCRVLHA